MAAQTAKRETSRTSTLVKTMTIVIAAFVAAVLAGWAHWVLRKIVPAYGGTLSAQRISAALPYVVCLGAPLLVFRTRRFAAALVLVPISLALGFIAGLVAAALALLTLMDYAWM